MKHSLLLMLFVTGTKKLIWHESHLRMSFKSFKSSHVLCSMVNVDRDMWMSVLVEVIVTGN